LQKIENVEHRRHDATAPEEAKVERREGLADQGKKDSQRENAKPRKLKRAPERD
jgi:hypothetical protein